MLPNAVVWLYDLPCYSQLTLLTLHSLILWWRFDFKYFIFCAFLSFNLIGKYYLNNELTRNHMWWYKLTSLFILYARRNKNKNKNRQTNFAASKACEICMWYFMKIAQIRSIIITFCVSFAVFEIISTMVFQLNIGSDTKTAWEFQPNRDNIRLTQNRLKKE